MAAEPRKSSELRQRLGDPSKGAEPTKSKRQGNSAVSEPYQSGRIPIHPPEVLDKVGKQAWRDITDNADWLVRSDVPALTMLCQLQSKVNEILDKAKLSTSDAQMVKLQFDLYARFGLDPNSRLQMGLAVAETESKLSAFRNEHK